MADAEPKKDYIKEELVDTRREQKNNCKPLIQFSKVIVLFLMSNLVFIEYYSIYLMEKYDNITALYALMALAGGEAISGIIWYMKNSAVEKQALANKEIQLIKLVQEREDGAPIDYDSLTADSANVFYGDSSNRAVARPSGVSNIARGATVNSEAIRRE